MFKDNVRKYRKLKGFSQDYVADKLGYKSDTTVQKWEDGTSTPPMATLKKLAQLLGTTIEVLCADNGGILVASDEGGQRYQDNCKTIDMVMRDLNLDGQDKLIDYAKDIVSMDKYRKFPISKVNPDSKTSK